MGFRTEERQVDVGPGTGADGLFHVLRRILRLRRLQQIVINSRGSVSFTVMVPEGEELILSQDIAAPVSRPKDIVVSAPYPASIVSPPGEPVAKSILRLFAASRAAATVPTGFVVSPDSALWEMLDKESGAPVARDTLFGWSVHLDDTLPPDTVVLCTATVIGAALADTTHTFVTSIGA